MSIKVSIITAVYNRSSSISKAVRSLQSQKYNHIEHIVIDGGSTDGTLELIKGLLNENTKLVSEPDRGIYHALNKGIAMSSGDVIGFLHSDDVFSDNEVIQDVANAFNSNIDGVYGDLNYVSSSNSLQIIRHWRAGSYRKKNLDYGWMPPHPAFFLKKSFIDRLGGFNEQFQISADYDAMIRYLVLGDVRLNYIPRVLVNMAVGGESNRSLERIWRKSMEDLKIIRKYKLGFLWGIDTLFFKNATKIPQFFRR